MSMNIRFVKDLTGLDALGNGEAPINEALSICADAVVEYIKHHWSGASPSAPGEPPAVVSGDLDASIYAESAGRSGSGAFAKGGAIQSQFVQVTSPYAAALEYGYAPRNLEPRPFIVPAISDAGEHMAEYFVKAFAGFKYK